MGMNKTLHSDIHQAALDCLMQTDPGRKLDETRAAQQAWQEGKLKPNFQAPAPQTVPQPGRPPKPVLVLPGKVPKRGYHTLQQRGALLHSLAHIEFNAINLAWDAVYRFRDLPHAFYNDWISVACDEAKHFAMLQKCLQTMGYNYGDFAAHNGLWQTAVDTAGDLVLRMALVPRVLEARGLDITQSIETRLRQANEHEAADALVVIRQEEVAHVRIGTHWFRYGCQQRNWDPHETFFRLVRQYMPHVLRTKTPMDRQARMQAGFTCQELDALCSGQAD